ncbi:MAG: bifunctional ADP-heptose synthase [Chitinophagaceae bacterium]|nr:bifunctional ADP-heptose synthase [Chitinophagaceae bacterium]
MKDLESIFQQMNQLKVGVIGDLMLDTYLMGRVDRISPEAPVPVISLQHREHRIGGAGNVALNAASLGASVAILGVLGDDDDANLLTDLFEKKGISTQYAFRSGKRITTNKMRIISRNQQMMRVDAEVTHDLDKGEEAHLLEKLNKYIEKEKPHILILEDYNKGVLTEGIIDGAIALCQAKGILTAVDPKRKNFFAYQEVDIFKPNLKEVREALNLLPEALTLQTLREIHHALADKLQHRISFITLSEQGVFYQEKEKAAILPSHMRDIADVSGAGDTVIAVASLVYAVTKNPHLMAEIANIAGGLVCEQVGTAAINKERLFQECELLLS